MRLLLINPRGPESFWTFRWALDNVLPGKLSADVTLRIEACDAAAVERLLRRLRRYGDRISLSIGGALSQIVKIDSSKFYVVFE